jgi:beta-1,2-mannobiose phosphorylase / 1,2-beta-oligomannan phosphorylase
MASSCVNSKGLYLLSGLIVLLGASLTTSCNRASTATTEASSPENDVFPEELVSFVPYENNPVFTGSGKNTWDHAIRERGYIVKEDDGYHMWYTGFRGDIEDPVMTLGYAMSTDGIQWTRFTGNPIFTKSWVEDMMVVKRDSVYYMFAEGRNDIAHLLTSRDKVNWIDHGSLKIRQTNGQPLSPGPYGTPTVYIEDNIWYLFYERNDEGIWLATSRDVEEWTNVQDEPVIRKGPESYDKFGVALNQVIKYGDRYYGYYHGTPTEDWSVWNTNVAVSNDLVHWKKYEGNPILEENKSSGILVDDGENYRLYSMHDKVQLHFPSGVRRKQ